ncbi:LOW QUALITY PROTEIN: uncharacterized protein LOC143150322 [Ptiloglossa arizonensis]|uniref:LOW QUALITY PROTEIN: uncharacterized protein LOC143150322 n=1 Tax=Ptiloglossa arizonensis TaxID=3350558 RepID=UPI003FA15B7A
MKINRDNNNDPVIDFITVSYRIVTFNFEFQKEVPAETTQTRARESEQERLGREGLLVHGVGVSETGGIVLHELRLQVQQEVDHDAHLAQNHEGSGKSKFTSKRKFACMICGLICSRKETLRSHFVRKHTQRYEFSCEQCGKEFKIKGDLTTHTRLNHREPPVICDVCGKTCRNSHSLYTHQKHAHYKAKYECPVCHRRLVTKENLDQHVLTQHEKKEKSVCEECGKTFFENHDFRKHMRIHTGDKPYSCTVCARAFTTHSSLSQHLLLHTGERIYVCDVCGKSFAQKAGLICHRKIHSGTLPPLPVMHIDHILKEFMKK